MYLIKDGMYASYVSGDLFSFTFFYGAAKAVYECGMLLRAGKRWEMKKRSHLHHNRSFLL